MYGLINNLSSLKGNISKGSRFSERYKLMLLISLGFSALSKKPTLTTAYCMEFFIFDNFNNIKLYMPRIYIHSIEKTEWYHFNFQPTDHNDNNNNVL